ncbi:metal ABC transporter permease [Peptoniphilus obesi]|uniref:metal ABC transporter permease n=1 Tax=Peptoniphilus obesi TaxID=1472765 RepID=UPI0004B8DD25|nr:metal ABC transporter permease [Peptoniphilus obesi]
MEIFQYTFMNKALIVGLLLSIIIPFIGVVVVNKKISLVGDALSHVSLSGIMIGLVAGVSPTIVSIFVCVIAVLFLEFIRNKFPSYQEISTAIIMSTGIGLASLMSGFVKTAANFESYLFGSILAISNFEFILIIILSIFVFLTFVYLYRELMSICFDEVSARISGINVNLINTIFMILIAITISISARIIGILIISSLMVIPVACAMRFKFGYFKTVVLSSVFGLFFTMAGLFISFYLGLKPGGTIVLIAVLTLVIILISKNNK